MKKNKTGKYFKYAIGEIILVVIGILIALSINNWNEERKNRQLERNALDELKQDLLKSMVDIEQDLGNQISYLESAWRIKNHLNNSNVFPDSLGHDLLMMTKDAFLFPVSKTYLALKSSGFKTLSNDSIRMQTDKVYEIYFPRLVLSTMSEPDIEAYFASYVQKHFRAFSTDLLFESEKEINEFTSGELYYVGKGNGSKYIPRDYEQFRNDPEFSIFYDNSMRWRVKKIMKYKIAKENVRALINMIEKNQKEYE